MDTTNDVTVQHSLNLPRITRSYTKKANKLVEIRVIRGKKEIEAGVSRVAPERLPNDEGKTVPFVYDKVLSSFSYGPDHPMNPPRLHRTFQLLESYGVFGWQGATIVPPVLCSEQDLLSFHTPAYVSAVQSLSQGNRVAEAQDFGFGPGDNPVFEGMYDAFRWQVSASLTAVAQVVESGAGRVFSIAGGLHHAMPAKASGFCVFNDVAIAIGSLLERGYRVAYVDIDAHHGDGVQQAFYDSDRALTVSIHEGPTFLFPGTGDVDEIGVGQGKGYALNIPLPPYTNDEVYHWAFTQVVPQAIELFSPDILVVQAGIDTHYQDPLTHLNVTTRGYLETLRTILALSSKCVVLGGGGYYLPAVSKSWTRAYATMLGRETDLPDKLPASYAKIYGNDQLRDPQADPLEADTSEYVWGYVRQKVKQLQRNALPWLNKAQGTDKGAQES